MRRFAGLIALALCLAALAATTACGGEGCPAPAVYEAFHKNMDELRAALARRFGSTWSADRLPESVRGEYERLTDAERKAANDARDLAGRWEDIAAKVRHAEFDREGLAARQRQIDREQKDLNDKIEDLNRRREATRRDAVRHNMSQPLLTDAAAMARWNAEAEVGNRTVAAQKTEQAGLQKEQAALDARREKLVKDFAEIAARIAGQIGRRSALMREMAPFMSRAGGDAMHALALARLIGSGEEISSSATERQQSYAEVAADADRQLAETVAREAALQLAKRTVLGATGPGVAVLAVDVTLATGNAAVETRTREVERNLLLIGDYGRVLKRMKEGGTLKADDPHYQAIRAVLKEQGEAMPDDGADVLIEGLKSWRAAAAAMTATLSGLAGNYVGGKAERAGTVVVSKLSSMERRVIGPRMVRYFKTAINSVAESGSGTVAGQVVDGGGKLIDEQLFGPKPPEAAVRPVPGAGSPPAPRWGRD
jgi:uncharacterized membrane-anchored protein YhcB (DUF1043 family)